MNGELPAVDPVADEGVATLRHAARSGLWSVAAYAGSAGAAFVISIIVGRALGPVSLGRYSYYLWVLRVAPTIIALGVPLALSKIVAEKLAIEDGAAARAVFRLVLRWHLLVLGPIGLAVIAGAALVDPDALGLITVLVGGGLVALVVLDIEGMLGGLRQFRALSVASGATGVAQVIGAVVAVQAGLGWLGLLGVFIAIGAVCLAGMLAYTHRAIVELPKRRLERAAVRAFARFAGVAAASVVVEALLWGRLELVFLEWFRGSDDVGYYSAALRLASLAAVLPIVAGRPLLPEFSRLRGTGAHEALEEVFRLACTVLAFFAAPIALVGAAVAPAAVRLVYGGAFGTAAAATTILAATSLLLAVAGPLGMVLLTGPRARTVVELGAAAVVANVVLDVLLIPPFGLVGAASANALAQVSWIVVAARLVRAQVGLAYPVGVLFRAIAAGVCGVVVALAVASLTGDLVTVLLGSAAGIAAYAVASVRLGVAGSGELAALGLTR